MIGKAFKQFRSSVTGGYVTALFAKLHPRETQGATPRARFNKRELALLRDALDAWLPADPKLKARVTRLAKKIAAELGR